MQIYKKSTNTTNGRK